MTAKPKFHIWFRKNPYKLAVSIAGNPRTYDALLRQLGGRFNKKDNYWAFPPTFTHVFRVMDMFKDLNPDIDPEVIEYSERPDGFTHVPMTDVEAACTHTDFTALLPAQQEAVQFAYSTPHPGGLLAMASGTGKTRTAIVIADVLKAKQILVIAPLTLLPDWKAEIHSTWLGSDVEIVHQDGIGLITQWVVTNYETASRYWTTFQGKFDLLIIDESVKVKNRTANRTKNLLKIAKTIKTKWLLSASSITKHADDMFTQLNFIDHTYFTSYWRFATRYCIIEETVWGDKVVGTKPNVHLQKEFTDLMFVRSRDQVLPNLPQEHVWVIEALMTPGQARMYEEIDDDFRMKLAEGGFLDVPSRQAQLIRMLQLVSHPRNLDKATLETSGKWHKLRALLKIRSFKFPAIIWTHWVETAWTLGSELTAAGYAVGVITGKNFKDRKELLDKFKSDQLEILVMSMGTGKYGLTLTNAYSAVYYDRLWDADAYFQSLARIPRYGLDHEVAVYILHTSGTVDDLVADNLAGKVPAIANVSNQSLVNMLERIHPWLTA